MSEASELRSWPDVIGALMAGQDIGREAAAWAMGEIFTGAATAAQIAGFTVALRAKGETVDEVEGLVETMYDHAITFSVPGRVVDIVGTGGDRAKTVNISSMSAVAMAGAGAHVVKHGNRAASSASGSADVLEALGVRLNLPAERIRDVAVEAGITFCFAPVFHSSMRHAIPVRAELGVPTTFNVLGPLTNPAR
ncbi:MAG: anthranilate phosphoribosyltransferase, partial [Nocardioidaceae bacterium]